MESLPRRQASQRRPSPEQTSSQASSHAATSPVRARAEDSQTLFLNSPHQESAGQDGLQKEQRREPSNVEPAVPDAEDVKKCWICFADSTEDTPETSPWRDPCPCALVAHEECLLDWIADMEAPNNRRAQRGVTAPKIECPQCKSEIRLARPRDLIVNGVRALERIQAQITTPGALAVLTGILYNGSMILGVHSTYAIFGTEDGFRILRPLLLSNFLPPLTFDSATPREVGQRMLAVSADRLAHWRLYAGLPLLTPMLILSRTTLADSILPVLPILFFATQTHSPQDTIDFGQWPPSASLAFALLPYIRSAYNTYYQKVWATKERQWLKEIQPRVREGQAEELGNVDPEGAAADPEDGNVFEVRIDGGIWEDWENDSDDEAGPVNIADDAAPIQLDGVADPAPQQEADQAGPPPDIADNRRQRQQAAAADQQNPNAVAQDQAQQPVVNGERRLSFSPSAIAETIIGALVFPSIAGVSGELLKLVLPRSWTTPPVPYGALKRVPARGLLQEKWGRSLVGGCLFVVVKDCIMLYARWRMAQMHRRRRVMDYQGEKKRGEHDAASAR